MREPGELWLLVILPPVLSPSSESSPATGTTTARAALGRRLGSPLNREKSQINHTS